MSRQSTPLKTGPKFAIAASLTKGLPRNSHQSSPAARFSGQKGERKAPNSRNGSAGRQSSAPKKIEPRQQQESVYSLISSLANKLARADIDDPFDFERSSFVLQRQKKIFKRLFDTLLNVDGSSPKKIVLDPFVNCDGCLFSMRRNNRNISRATKLEKALKLYSNDTGHTFNKPLALRVIFELRCMTAKDKFAQSGKEISNLTLGSKILNTVTKGLTGKAVYMCKPFRDLERTAEDLVSVKGMEQWVGGTSHTTKHGETDESRTRMNGSAETLFGALSHRPMSSFSSAFLRFDYAIQIPQLNSQEVNLLTNVETKDMNMSALKTKQTVQKDQSRPRTNVVDQEGKFPSEQEVQTLENNPIDSVMNWENLENSGRVNCASAKRGTGDSFGKFHGFSKFRNSLRTRKGNGPSYSTDYSLLGNQAGKSGRNAIGKKIDHSSDITCLMLLVQGIPSPKYKFNIAEERFVPCSSGKVSSACSSVLDGLTAPWTRCGTMYRRLERGLSYFSNEQNGGKIMAAFSSAVLSYFATHCAYAVSLSETISIRQNPREPYTSGVHVVEIISYMEPWIQRIYWLADLCYVDDSELSEDVQPGFRLPYRGGQLLSYIHEELSAEALMFGHSNNSNFNESSIRHTILKHLFVRSLAPWTEYLCTWLFTSNVQQKRQCKSEFLIEATDNNSAFKNDNFFELQFNFLRKNEVPSFLDSNICRCIVRAAEYLYLLSMCDMKQTRTLIPSLLNNASQRGAVGLQLPTPEDVVAAGNSNVFKNPNDGADDAVGREELKAPGSLTSADKIRLAAAEDTTERDFLVAAAFERKRVYLRSLKSQASELDRKKRELEYENNKFDLFFLSKLATETPRALGGGGALPDNDNLKRAAKSLLLEKYGAKIQAAELRTKLAKWRVRRQQILPRSKTALKNMLLEEANNERSRRKTGQVHDSNVLSDKPGIQADDGVVASSKQDEQSGEENRPAGSTLQHDTEQFDINQSVGEKISDGQQERSEMVHTVDENNGTESDGGAISHTTAASEEDRGEEPGPSKKTLAQSGSYQIPSDVGGNVVAAFPQTNIVTKNKIGKDVLVKGARSPMKEVNHEVSQSETTSEKSNAHIGGLPKKSMLVVDVKKNEHTPDKSAKNSHDNKYQDISIFVKRIVLDPALRQCKLINKAALKYFVETLQIKNVLVCIRDYVLMNKGHVMQEFVGKVWNGIRAPGIFLDWSLESVVNGAFKGALSTFKADENVVKECLFHRVSQNPTTTRERGTAYSPFSLDYISPEIQLKWPCNVVITKSHLTSLVEVNTTLMRLQVMAHMLHRSWVSLKVICAERRKLDTFKKLPNVFHIYRRDASQFVDAFYNYVVQSADVSWVTLYRELEGANTNAVEDLHGLILAFENFTCSTLERTFIRNKKVMNCLIENLSTIAELCAMIETLYVSVTALMVSSTYVNNEVLKDSVSQFDLFNQQMHRSFQKFNRGKKSLQSILTELNAGRSQEYYGRELLLKLSL